MTGWRVLTPADESCGQPLLLIKDDLQFTDDGYSVYITDLIHIWHEHMTGRAIRQRALNDNTIIDPSDPRDGGRQLQLLLDKIKFALDGSDGTSHNILPTANEKDLFLELQAELPAPLEPLRWRMSLAKQHGDILFRELLLPAFERSLQAQEQVQSLLKGITQKDHVITRLIDKLDNAGIDLSNVFPGAHAFKGSKARVQATLLRSVPGLAVFDAEQWREDTGQKTFASNADLFHDVFADLGESVLAKSWKSPDHWWTKLDQTGRELGPAGVRSHESEKPTSLERTKTDADGDDDGFQVQDMTRLRHKHEFNSTVQVKDSQGAQAGLFADDMSTTDDGEEQNDDDLDAPVKAASTETLSSSTPSKAEPPAPTKRLGMLGKKHNISAASTSPSPVPESIPQESQPKSELSPRSERPQKRLGKIGGMQRRHEDADMKELPLRDSQETYTKAHNLEDEQSDPVTSATSNQAQTPFKETTNQKAGRRRVELKRDLEEKKNAPVTKKRRF